MSRVSNREIIGDRQNPLQVALFDDAEMPLEAGALESIRSRRYEHQGIRLVDDDMKAFRLVELLALKWGVKKISREMNVSAHTVRAARRLLVAQGKMAPYKQRVVERMEDAIEAGVENYREALEQNRVPAAQIPIGVAIMFDKRALALGEPTSIRGESVAPEALRVEDINAYFENLPSCKPVDSESTVAASPSKQTKENGAAEATLDARQAQAGPAAGTDGDRPMPA